jgi:Flp pilus assembly protein TadD
MYRLIYIFLFFSLSFAIEIDIKNLEKHLQKNDVKNRLLIAKYYIKNDNFDKAKKYLLEILKIDPKNHRAKKFLSFISLKEKFINYLKNNNISNIDEYYKNLYMNQKYQKIRNLSTFIIFINSDYPKLVTAKIFMWDGKYNKSKDILKLVKNKKTLDYLEIKANDCFYLGDYNCAKRLFSTLYYATYKIDYAYKLIDTYLFLGEFDKADLLISKLLKAYPHAVKLKKYRKKILKVKNSQLEKLKKIYKKSKKFSDLQNLVFVLLNSKKNKEAYKLLEDYISKNPKDENAKFWYATYLSWYGENKKALKILENIKDEKNYKAKLLKAKIISWNGNFVKAINYLNDIISNSQDKKLIIDAKEAKGLIYYWQQNYAKAKPLLKEVLKYKSSLDAKEALMIMTGNVKPLIKKYMLLYKKEPSNLDYILKIAQLSERIKDVDTAIKFYEKYYAINPKVDIAYSLAQLYLIKKNPYKAFGYYEYWAYQVNSEKSLLELAKAYYYNGYNKSALEVIDEILKKYPNSQKAIDLKAEILKYNPKFTQNNSAKSIQDVLNEKSQKLLKFANRLYFNGYYVQANEYFKKYLLENSDDYTTRERYAYSLEYTGKYKKASAEFFLMTWMKKNCELLYHYGFNLEKSGQKEKAKKVYEEAKKYSLKPLNKELKLFISNWKKAWESLDINKYKKFYSKKYTNNKFWLIRKENIFKSVKFISLYLAGESLLSKKVKNNYTVYKVRFYQQYTTDTKRDRGYKTLTLRCNKNNKCVITQEEWEEGEFKPVDYNCYKKVNNRIQNLFKDIPHISMHTLLLEKKNSKKNQNFKNKIILDKSLKKDLSTPEEVFATFDVNFTKKFVLPKNQNLINDNYTINDKNNKFGITGYYNKDNTGLTLLKGGIYYQNKFLYLDFQKWKLYKDKKRNGKFITLKVKKNPFILGAEIGKYEGFSYIYPYLEYSGYFDYKLYQDVVGREKESFCAVDKHLNSLNFSISRYKGANFLQKKDIIDYWYSLEFSKISDNNLVITPQFEYRFDKYNTISNDLSLYYYLSGWYLFDSKETNCYYSPKKYDSTFLEIHPVYKNIEFIGKVGYSFFENSLLYSYGINLQYTDLMQLECMKNYSYKQSVSGYSYIECFMNMGVKW